MVSACLRTVSTIGTLSRRVRVSQVVAAVPSASAWSQSTGSVPDTDRLMR